MPGVSQDDLEIIQITLAESPEAFGELIDKYQHRLYNSIVQIFGKRDAEDIVQDAFFKSFLKLSTFRGNSSFYTWLYRIAHNTAVSYQRKRSSNVSIEALQEAISDSLADDCDAPSHRLEKEERDRHVRRAMALLKEEHRTVLVLREIEGMSYEIIAGILSVPIGTINSRLHRARTCLRDKIGDVIDRCL